MSYEYCCPCGAIFNEDDLDIRDESFPVPYGMGYVMKPEYGAYCPECGGQEYKHTHEFEDDQDIENYEEGKDAGIYDDPTEYCRDDHEWLMGREDDDGNPIQGGTPKVKNKKDESNQSVSSKGLVVEEIEQQQLPRSLQRKFNYGYFVKSAEEVANKFKNGDGITDVQINNFVTEKGNTVQYLELTAEDGTTYIGEIRSVNQINVYTTDGKQVGYSIFPDEFKPEVLRIYGEPVYEFVGGPLNGETMSRLDVEHLPQFAGKYSLDSSKERAAGGFTHDPILDNQPLVQGYLGPMLNGFKNGTPVLRYETQEVYDRLSEDTTTQDDGITIEESIDSTTENTAKHFGIYDKITKIEKELLAIDGVTDVEFDLDGYWSDIPQIIVLPEYDLDVHREDYYDARKQQLRDIVKVLNNNGCVRTEDSIEDYGQHWYIVTTDKTYKKPTTTEDVNYGAYEYQCPKCKEFTGDELERDVYGHRNFRCASCGYDSGNVDEWERLDTNDHLMDEGAENDDDFDAPEIADQSISSAKTSINSTKLPAVFGKIKLEPGTTNLDIGGGKFDNVAQELAKLDVTNSVYDPYNRSQEHNKTVLRQIKANSGADSVTCSNVLNVIKEPEARLAVIKNCYKYLKPGQTAYFTVYEGKGDGKEAETKSGYQLNRKTVDYLPEITSVFENAKIRGKVIICTK